MNTSEKLDHYVELEKATEDRRRTLDNWKQEMIDSVTPLEVKEKIREIEEEFKPKYDALGTDEIAKGAAAELAQLKKEITAETIAAGESLKGRFKMAVLTKEKTEKLIVVNTGILKGMTVNIPKLHECWVEKEETTPASVTFRKI